MIPYQNVTLLVSTVVESLNQAVAEAVTVIITGSNVTVPVSVTVTVPTLLTISDTVTIPVSVSVTVANVSVTVAGVAFYCQRSACDSQCNSQSTPGRHTHDPHEEV